MCKLVEELIDMEKKESALKFIKVGKLSNEEIAECLSLPLEIIDELSKTILE